MVRLKKKNLMDTEKTIISLNPKKLVSHFYDKVDLTSSAVLIFIAIFLESLVLLFLSAPNVILNFTYRIIFNFIFSWIIMGLIFYLILYFLKGKDKVPKGEYKRILSGLASFRVVSIISIFVVIIISLIFLPKFISFFPMVLQDPGVIDAVSFPKLTGWGLTGLILLFIFIIAIVVYYFCLFYRFVEKMYNQTPIINFLMFLILLVVMYFITIFI